MKKLARISKTGTKTTRISVTRSAGFMKADKTSKNKNVMLIKKCVNKG